MPRAAPAARTTAHAHRCALARISIASRAAPGHSRRGRKRHESHRRPVCPLPRDRRRSRRNSEIPGRRRLAEAAAERLDHGPGSRRRRRRAGPRLGRAAAEDADRRREGRDAATRRARSAASRRRRCSSSTRQGNLVQAWGGPGQGYDWPQNEHGIHIDHKGYVWLAGNGEQDDQILKFTRDGKFVLQIGKPGPQTNSNDTTRLGRPAHMVVDPATNELYVADGYGNHRVIVFDADTGAYKRHWGAYGKPPTDDKLPPYDPSAAPAQQFSQPGALRAHRARRARLRLRPRERPHPGVPQGRHLREGVLRREGRRSPTARSGTWSSSPDQGETYIMNADGANNEVRTLVRDTGEVRRRLRPQRPPGRATSTGCTTSPSTRRATSTRPRSTPGSGRRNSCFAATWC